MNPSERENDECERVGKWTYDRRLDENDIADLASLLDRLAKAELALKRIRDERIPQVCENYMECTHIGCRASYEAFAIADEALRSPMTTEAPDLMAALKDSLKASPFHNPPITSEKDNS